MKGVIKIVDPSLDVQDICHEIKSFDPWEASMSLNTVEPYWPKGSIFVSVVDPGVGTKRLASGLITFEQVGEKYPVEEVVICEEYEKKPVLGQCSASGFIQSGLKHFGGIQVNITNEEWKQCGFQLGDMVHTVIMHNGEMVFEKDILYHEAFGCVEKSEPILYCGSSRYLCLDCNMDNFMGIYGIESGKEWEIAFTKV